MVPVQVRALPLPGQQKQASPLRGAAASDVLMSPDSITVSQDGLTGESWEQLQSRSLDQGHPSTGLSCC